MWGHEWSVVSPLLFSIVVLPAPKSCSNTMCTVIRMAALEMKASAALVMLGDVTVGEVGERKWH